jgi:putative transposase
MARKPRIHFPGACYHVMLRGNAGQELFIDDHDRQRFLSLLEKGVARFRHLIHAYCLMTNHVHLVIQVAEVPLSRIIQNVSFRFTRFVNTTRNRAGHLFQGRYKAVLVDGDRYLLELVRYIHTNPVRAGLVSRSEQYPWSSHGVYLGETTLSWLTTDWVLAQFAGQRKRAVALYREFLQADTEGTMETALQNGLFEGRILGSEQFVQDALAQAEERSPQTLTVEQVLAQTCAFYRLDRQAVSSARRDRAVAQVRAVAAYLIRESDHLSLTELAELTGRDLSGLSRAASRLQQKMAQDEQLCRELEEVKDGVSRRGQA